MNFPNPLQAHELKLVFLRENMRTKITTFTLTAALLSMSLTSFAQNRPPESPSLAASKLSLAQESLKKKAQSLSQDKDLKQDSEKKERKNLLTLKEFVKDRSSLAKNGGSSDGGGFVSENSLRLLEMSSQELSTIVKRTSRKIFANLKIPYTRRQLSEIFQNIRVAPNDRNWRNGQELMFDFGSDANGPYIVALSPFFHIYGAVPIKFMSKTDLKKHILDLRLKMLHESAHLWNLNEDESENFGMTFLTAVENDAIYCKGKKSDYLIQRSTLQSFASTARSPWHEEQFPGGLMILEQYAAQLQLQRATPGQFEADPKLLEKLQSFGIKISSCAAEDYKTTAPNVLSCIGKDLIPLLIQQSTEEPKSPIYTQFTIELAESADGVDIKDVRISRQYNETSESVSVQCQGL